jgi:hypothetical protein
MYKNIVVKVVMTVRLFIFNLGRLLWQNYLGSSFSLVSTLLNVVRQRVGLPPPPFEEVPAVSVFSDGFKPQMMDQLQPDLEPAESLGPLEAPTPSVGFRRNFSSAITNGYDLWNTFFTPTRCQTFFFVIESKKECLVLTMFSRV